MLDFDFVVFLKETQLQHGLRSEDYARYGRYLTNRVATLRGQLGLSNDRKKFLGKTVTAQNAVDNRHLMLLALYAERCWAAAEEAQARRNSKRDRNELLATGGVPPADFHRKKLNKAAKWAHHLCEVAAAVGSPRLQRQCAAYDKEIAGAGAAAHKDYAAAKQLFADARAAYAELHGDSEGQQAAVLASKVSEMDDRVVFCMQRLGEDVTSYRPPRLQAAGGDGEQDGVGRLSWNGRELTVTSLKVKEALREALAAPVEEAQARLLETVGPVALGQSNRVLDLMDRRIGAYNDALDHAQQDLHGAGAEGQRRTELQLIVHYLLFHVSHETMRRTLFLAELYARRFHATERAVQTRAAGGRRAQVSPAQYASPLEVARLYSAAGDAVEQMELLPGVGGREDVEELSALCRAGRLLFLGESWRVLERDAAAAECFAGVRTLLRDATHPRAVELRQHAERAALRLAAAAALPQAASPSLPVAFLSDVSDQSQVGVAQNVCHFPPDFQAAPCKPVFVDIASTYVDFPVGGGGYSNSGPTPVAGTNAASAAGGSRPAADANNDGKNNGNNKGWGWKLWGNKS